MQNVEIKDQTPHCSKHVLPAVPSSEVYLEDCVTALKRFNDNHFDLAIVDPPYGIGLDGGKIGGDNATNAKDYTKKDWDNSIPNKEYYQELFRVSKNQIIWGGNYMIEFLYPSKGWIVWKKMDISNNFCPFELAWTSYQNGKMIDYLWAGMWQKNMKDKEKRIHPTQKPVALYDWILHHYAKPNDLILDTHLGSGSSRISAYKGGFNFVGFEIDQEYYEKQEKRFNDFKSQLRLF
jgi:site-specific DNA-methyltransferase (adenine-specific)